MNAKRKAMPLTPGGRPQTLSKSKIAGIDFCEWAWKLGYIDGHWPKPTVAMKAGTALHHAVEKFAKAKMANKIMTLETFQRHAQISFADSIERGVWQPNCNNQKEIDQELFGVKKKIDRLAEKWHNDNAIWIQPYLVEQSFEVPISVGGEKIVLNGFLDMIKRDPDNEDGFILTDSKFGMSASAKHGQAAADVDPGLTMYHIANQHVWKLNITGYELDCYKIMAKGIKHERYVTHRDESDVSLFLARAATVCEMVRLNFYRPAPIGHWKCKPMMCGHFLDCKYRQRVSE